LTEVAYDDLPQTVRPMARQFYSLFHLMRDQLPEGAAKEALVRRLLELRADALALLAPGGTAQEPPGTGEIGP
jgi:hypothetical protein